MYPKLVVNHGISTTIPSTAEFSPEFLNHQQYLGFFLWNHLGGYEAMRSDFVPCVPDGVDAFLFPGGGAVNQNDPEKHRGLRKKGVISIPKLNLLSWGYLKMKS